MKQFKRSLELAYILNQDTPKEFKFHHFSFLFHKKKLVSIGRNNPLKQSRKALYFAERYNIKKWKDYPFLHAETAAISRVWGNLHIDSSFTMVVLRIDKTGNLVESKPCKNCWEVINSLGIQCYWSTNDGEINGSFKN